MIVAALAVLCQARVSHNGVSWMTLSDDRLRQIAQKSDMKYFMGPLLDPLLRVRVPGTPGNAAVRKYIVDYIKNRTTEWHLELDTFEDNTPFGRTQFSNIIATLDRSAPRRLVLACHYDSKYFATGKFVGATDSAVPCAMLLDLVRIYDTVLSDRKYARNITLQLLFFDGEEAFQYWSPTDSIYGARHLAAKMESRPHPYATLSHLSELDAIEAFVLLDLIGVRQPKFHDFFPDTSHQYQELQLIERRLKSLDLLREHTDSYFSGPWLGRVGIEDDHIPFLRRGVPILHLIAHPFPRVWHTTADNKTALDPVTIDNFNRVLRTFLVEYLHLPEPVERTSASSSEAVGRTTASSTEASSKSSSLPVLVLVLPMLIITIVTVVKSH